MTGVAEKRIRVKMIAWIVGEFSYLNYNNGDGVRAVCWLIGAFNSDLGALDLWPLEAG